MIRPRATRLLRQMLSKTPQLHEALLVAKYRLLPVRAATEPVGDSRQEVFSGIYASNGWHNEESRSGDGSTARYTAHLRSELPDLLHRLGVRTFLDAPCGDFVWMRDVALPHAVTYIGGDIVPALVESLQQEYARPDRDFVQLDVANDPLPAADLWMCRDCLIHLPNETVLSVLENFARSDITYLLTTTYTYPPNVDIPIGQFRPVNLRAAPFSLPKPIETMFDYIPPWPPRRLALYSNEQLKQWAAQRDRVLQ